MDFFQCDQDSVVLGAAGGAHGFDDVGQAGY
jgi:hypothetical protein